MENGRSIGTDVPLATPVARAGAPDARRRSAKLRLPWISVTVLGVVFLCAVLAPVVAPYDPNAIELLDAEIAPGTDHAHLLGTDLLGRDMLSRLIYGAQSATYMVVVALGSGAVAGTLLGLVSGYRGGKVDGLIMRVADAAMGFPTILVAMIIVVLLGTGSMTNVILAVALTVWARFARMIRGEVLRVKNSDFVTLARIAGIPAATIVRRHVFPNTMNTLAIVTSLQVGQVILLEASLSFLGLGLPPGAPAWGIMVAEGRSVIVTVWWLSLLPGLAITAVVLACNFLGDWMRDTLDPKLRDV